MHINKFGFSSLRKLCLHDGGHHSSLKEWDNDLPMNVATQVNIFIGSNGSGKSTILDIIDCLRDPCKLIAMQRENTQQGIIAGFKVMFEGCELIAVFNQQSLTEQYSINTQSVGLVARRTKDQHVIRQLPYKTISKFDCDEDAILSFQSIIAELKCTVFSWQSNSERKVNPNFVNELCQLGPYLKGLASSSKRDLGGNESPLTPIESSEIKKNPIKMIDERTVSLWLEDDLWQPSRVSVNMLPSGWFASGKLLSWLHQIPQNSICVIEEPENHLHPTLQRRVIERMGEIVRERNLQLFISSHSSTFMNTTLWGVNRISIFRTNGDTVENIVKNTQLLDDLGVRASDILQANGVIWVEGPSDRIYLKYWLNLWCEKYGHTIPLEHVDYCFIYYGGSMLKHFSCKTSPDFIDMLILNRNLVVLIDRDFDFYFNEEEIPVPKIADNTKARVMDEISSLDSESSFAWVTRGYTIECYIPEKLRSDYFDCDGKRLMVKPGKSKVAAAQEYLKLSPSFSECFENTFSKNLEQFIEKLYYSIVQWNH